MAVLFTIGHSNHSAEALVALLQQQGVTALADVRSHPYSRYHPQFNQAALKAQLAAQGLAYVFLGRELGARPQAPSCYVEGKAVYEKIAALPAFQTGLQRLLQGVEREHRIALMCAEQDPLTCHRAILVCQALRPYNLDIQHILKNGDLESHTALEARMLARHHLQELPPSPAVQLSLFPSTPSEPPLSFSERLSRAYQLQGDQIAYVERAASQPDGATIAD